MGSPWVTGQWQDVALPLWTVWPDKARWPAPFLTSFSEGGPGDSASSKDTCWLLLLASVITCTTWSVLAMSYTYDLSF